MDDWTRPVTTRLGALVAAMAISATSVGAQDKPFRSMTVEPTIEEGSVYHGVGPYGDKTLCVIPEPPSELTPTNGHEFAYMFWLEKLEMERRLETGECDCQVEAITWEEVGEQALPWLADESQTFPRKRRYMREDLKALQARVLEECAG